jgi:hypothetical protein
MTNQNGFESDEQEQYYLEQCRNQEIEAEIQKKQYEDTIESLRDIALELGIEHSISFLESLKEKKS